MKTNKYTIIKTILLQEDIFNYQKLANQLSISSKTIRNQINDIEEFLKMFNISLLRKSGVGIKIIGNKEDILNCYKKCILEIKNSNTLSSEIRQNIIIFTLLNRNKKVSMGYLEDILYITRPSIYNDLKIVNTFLKKYEITLEKTRKNGIKLIGGEKRIRKCLLDYSTKMFKEHKDNYLPYIDILEFMDYIFNNLENNNRSFLKEFINDIQEYSNIDINNNDIERIITLFLISFYRIKNLHSVKINKEIINKIKNTNIVTFLNNNKYKINNKFNIILDENEILYLSSLIESNTNYNDIKSENSYINQNIMNKIIDEFYIELKKHIKNLNKTYFSKKLSTYLIKVIKKSNFEYDIYNSNKEIIMIMYPKLFKLSSLINPIMKNSINKTLNNSGISTITLLLAQIYLKETNTLQCFYNVNNNIFEKELNLLILQNNIPNITITTNIKNADFIISNENIKDINIPVFISPTIFNDDFLKLLKQNIQEVIKIKSENFFINQ